MSCLVLIGICILAVWILERLAEHPQNRIPKPALMLAVGAIIVYFGGEWVAEMLVEDGDYYSEARPFGYAFAAITAISVYYAMSGKWKKWRKK